MKLKTILFLVVAVLFSSQVFASVEDVVDTNVFLMELIKSLGGIKGASGLAIAALVTQLIMKALQTPLAAMMGKYRLLVVALLSLVSGVLALMVSGVTLPMALLHSTTLTAVQVFVHQILKQFAEKKQ